MISHSRIKTLRLLFSKTGLSEETLQAPKDLLPVCGSKGTLLCCGVFVEWHQDWRGQQAKQAG